MTPLPTLTPRQGDALRAFKRFVLERGYAPTLREHGELLGIHSTNATTELRRRLITAGLLRSDSFTARAVVITALGEQWLRANPAPPPPSPPEAA